MAKLRKWAARKRYDMRFLPGEGGGGTNGVVALLDRDQGTFVRHQRAASRLLGIEVKHKTDAQTRAYAVLHGFHTAGFSAQLRAAASRAASGRWLRRRGGPQLWSIPL